MLKSVVVVLIILGVTVASKPFIFRIMRPQGLKSGADGGALHTGEEDYMASVYLQDGYLVIQELSEASPKARHQPSLKIPVTEIHFVSELKSIPTDDDQKLRGFDFIAQDEDIIIAANVVNQGWDAISKFRRKVNAAAFKVQDGIRRKVRQQNRQARDGDQRREPNPSQIRRGRPGRDLERPLSADLSLLSQMEEYPFAEEQTLPSAESRGPLKAQRLTAAEKRKLLRTSELLSTPDSLKTDAPPNRGGFDRFRSLFTKKHGSSLPSSNPGSLLTAAVSVGSSIISDGSVSVGSSIIFDGSASEDQLPSGARARRYRTRRASQLQPSAPESSEAGRTILKSDDWMLNSQSAPVLNVDGSDTRISPRRRVGFKKSPTKRGP